MIIKDISYSCFVNDDIDSQIASDFERYSNGLRDYKKLVVDKTANEVSPEFHKEELKECMDKIRYADRIFGLASNQMYEKGFERCISFSDKGSENSLLLRNLGSFENFLKRFVKLIVLEPQLVRYYQNFSVRDDGSCELAMYKEEDALSLPKYVFDMIIKEGSKITVKYFGESYEYAWERISYLGKETFGIKVTGDKVGEKLVESFLNGRKYTRVHMLENGKWDKEICYWSMVCVDSLFGRNADNVYIIPVKSERLSKEVL